MASFSKLYNVSQIREIESLALKVVDEALLMQRAGQAAFNNIREYYPAVKQLSIFCGAGNNGGDGLVVACLAAKAGLKVTVFSVGDYQKQTLISKRMYDEAVAAGVCISEFSQETQSLEDSELIVDALLGIGIQGIVKAPYSEAVNLINKSSLPVVSIDIPSGLNVNTGAPCGESVIAMRTTTFIGLKQGMVTGHARHYCGIIDIDSLGLEAILASHEYFAVLAGKAALQELLPKPVAHAHKGTQGHVVIVGGDEGMPGAVCLAGQAALRAGAGKVTIVTREKHFPIVMGARSEFICLVVEDELAPLKNVLMTADVCVVGPGMGFSKWSKRVFKQCLMFDGLKVLDAGALGLLSIEPVFIKNAIITPHPGEAAQLLSVAAKDIEDNRYHFAEKLVENFAEVVVLKGAGSLVFCQNDKGAVCALGNSGMATAGMGDVLSGGIGGMAAQLKVLKEAALVGVLLHSYAGDMAVKDKGALALLAGDLFNYFRVNK